MIPKEFAYSDQAYYCHASVVLKKKSLEIINQNIIVTLDGKSFKVSFPDVFEKHALPHVSTDDIVQR